MKRKQIDAGGQVVERDDASGEPRENAIPLPMPVAPTALPAPDLPLRLRMLAQLVAAHVWIARFIRRRVLLIDMDQREANLIRNATKELGLMVNAQTKMIHEVRTRLVYHEQGIPMLGESRRRYDSQMVIRREQKERAKSHTIPPKADG